LLTLIDGVIAEPPCSTAAAIALPRSPGSEPDASFALDPLQRQSAEMLSGLSSGSPRGAELETSLSRHLLQVHEELGRALRRADELRRCSTAPPCGLARGCKRGVNEATTRNHNSPRNGDVKVARAFLGLC
jgi:hypothetical protein